jgi:hypothetical protein
MNTCLCVAVLLRSCSFVSGPSRPDAVHPCTSLRHQRTAPSKQAPLAKTSPMCDHQRMGEHLCQTVRVCTASSQAHPRAVYPARGPFQRGAFHRRRKRRSRDKFAFLDESLLSVAGMATTVLRGKQVWVRDPALADEDVFYKGKVISEDEKNVRNTRPAGGPTSCFCPFPRICDLPCLQPGRQNLDPVLCVSGTGHCRITVGQLQHSSLAQGAHSRGASSFSNAFSVAAMLPCARKARVRAASDADAALAAARAAAATAASEGSAAAAAAASAVWQQL